MFKRVCALITKSLAPCVFLGFLLVVCGGVHASEDIFTIGMITNVQIHARTIEGFKAGMAQLGYIEGRDVRYVYNGIVDGGGESIDAEIENILSQDIDLFLTVANEVSLRVKKRLEGDDIPILIAGSSRPVEEGLLESLGRPGGHITGVRVADNYAKTLEWLTIIAPGTRKVLIPYNPDDAVSVVALDGLDESVAKMGIRLDCHPISSVEEAISIIENLPGDVDAVYRMPSPTLDSGNSRLSRAAIAQKVPLVACLPLDDAVLMTFTADLYRAGEQTARLAHLIHGGAKPSELPVETCDADLTINLKTAGEIGLNISDEVLLQAMTIIR